MEFRKNNHSNLENRKGVFFLLGMLTIVSVTYAAMSYKSYSLSNYDLELDVEEEYEELPPVTVQELKPPPPPPAKEAVKPEIKLVPDDEITEEPDFQDEDIDDIEVTDEPVGDDEPDEIEDIPTNFAQNMPYFKAECGVFEDKQARLKCTQAAIKKKIQDAFILPDIAREMGTEGKMYLQMVVNRQGKVSNVQVLQGLSTAVDKAAIKAVQALPNFVPGRNMDRSVSVIFNVPLEIVLE